MSLPSPSCSSPRTGQPCTAAAGEATTELIARYREEPRLALHGAAATRSRTCPSTEPAHPSRSGSTTAISLVRHVQRPSRNT